MKKTNEELQALVDKATAGDKKSLETLVAGVQDMVFNLSLRMLGTFADAEDATQETFLKAVRYFDRYIHKGKFKSFLYRIAANTCIDIRRETRSPDISLEESGIDPAYSESAFEAVRSDMALRQLVSDLPENQREIVLLRFGSDLTMRETAEVLNLPLRTVQSRLRSALKRLKADLGKVETNDDLKRRKMKEGGTS